MIIKANIIGKVQGVYFRQSTVDFVNTNSLNLEGFVRNLKDGSVEVVAAGDEVSIKKLLEFLKYGPPTARVDLVKVDKHYKCPSKLNSFERL